MAIDIATIQHGSQTDYKKLYYSNPDAALKVPITLQAGYGLLPVGTLLAQNISAAGNRGKFVPYNLTVFDGTEWSPGRAYLVADVTGVTYVYVTMDDSYKFLVGDDLIINDDNSSAENLGAITEIDRTTYPHMAKITATATISGSFDTANFAYVCVEAGAANNFSDAVGVLEKSVDTGTGEGSAGALATLVLKNAIMYSGMLANADSASRTKIGANTFGQYTYF